jgi:hypothetical protein
MIINLKIIGTESPNYKKQSKVKEEAAIPTLAASNLMIWSVIQPSQYQ